MTSGTTLATELPGIVSTLPKEYGGSGPTVKEGFTVSLVAKPEDAKTDEATETPKDDNAAPAAVEDKATDSNANGTTKTEPAGAPKISEAEAAITGEPAKASA